MDTLTADSGTGCNWDLLMTTVVAKSANPDTISYNAESVRNVQTKGRGVVVALILAWAAQSELELTGIKFKKKNASMDIFLLS